MTWTKNIQKHIFNIEHRHVIFTIPKECREFSFYDRSLLSKLSSAVNQIFKFIFHNISRKKNFLNIPNITLLIPIFRYCTLRSHFCHSYFWQRPEMEPSFISLGGFNKNLEFKKMRYFNVDTIAGQWKYHSFMDFIQGIFLTGLKRQLMLSGKTLPCQDIHFIKGRCTRLSG